MTYEEMRAELPAEVLEAADALDKALEAPMTDAQAKGAELVVDVVQGRHRWYLRTRSEA